LVADTYHMHTLDEALALESPPDHVANGIPKEYAAVLAIWERINSRMTGPTFDEWLTHGERLVHILFCVMNSEIENGGVHQFFSNSSGDLAEDAKAGLKEIGAKRVLDVLRKASEVFPKGVVPADRETRNDILEEHEDEEGDAFWKRFDNLSREYYKARQELYEYLLAWIRNHREEFALPDDETVRKANKKSGKKRKGRQSLREPSPEQLETLVQGAQKALEQLAGFLRMINVRAVTSPTKAQVSALRKFEPCCEWNLVAIRKALKEGPIRLGPLEEGAAAEAVKKLLAPVGLQCRLVPVAPDELT
jgi:hypothetical protein